MSSFSRLAGFVVAAIATLPKSTSPAITPTASASTNPWLTPDGLARAVALRESFGLPSGDSWIWFVASDPRSLANVEKYSIPITAAEVEEFRARIADGQTVLDHLAQFGNGHTDAWGGYYLDADEIVVLLIDPTGAVEKDLRTAVPALFLVKQARWPLEELTDLSIPVSDDPWLLANYHIMSAGTIQHALVASDVHAVYDALILRRRSTQLGPPVETTDDVLQLVILTHFDLDLLSVADVAALSKDGESLYELKQGVAQIAAKYPDLPPGSDREKDLTHAASEVIDAWEDSKMHKSRMARDFFSVGFLDKTSKLPEETIRAALHSVAGGLVAAGAAALGSAPIILAAALGILVGLVLYGAQTLSKHRAAAGRSPFRYVSAVAKHASWLAVGRPPDPSAA